MGKCSFFSRRIASIILVAVIFTSTVFDAEAMQITENYIYGVAVIEDKWTSIHNTGDIQDDSGVNLDEIENVETIEDNTPNMVTEATMYLSYRYFGQRGIHSPSGNYSQSFTSLTVPTILGELAFSHTFNSLDDDEESIVGKGFSFSYAMRLTEHPQNFRQKIVILPGGARQSFQENGQGIYEALDSRSTLTKSGADYILTTIDQMRYVFGDNGAIKSIEDFNNNRISLTADGEGRVTGISDPIGTSVNVTIRLYNTIT